MWDIGYIIRNTSFGKIISLTWKIGGYHYVGN